MGRANDYADLVGRKLGRFTVLRVAGPMLDVACECGAERTVRAWPLVAGKIRSCGCFMRERAATLNFAHGATRGRTPSPEYTAWQGMISRCERPSHNKFSLYGGRGIRVCDRWRHDFATFLADMGPKPSLRHSIDRIDPNGNYEPGNCRWATHTEQMRNRRDTWTVERNGVAIAVSALCERHGVPYKVVWARVHHLGWTLERALAMPMRRYRADARWCRGPRAHVAPAPANTTTAGAA